MMFISVKNKTLLQGKKICWCWVWWQMHVVSAFKRLRQGFTSSRLAWATEFVFKNKTGKERMRPLASLLPLQQTQHLYFLMSQRDSGKRSALASLSIVLPPRQSFVWQTSLSEPPLSFCVITQCFSFKIIFKISESCIIACRVWLLILFPQELLNMLCLLEHKHLCKHRPHFLMLLNIAAIIWAFISAFDVALSLWRLSNWTVSLKNVPPQLVICKYLFTWTSHTAFTLLLLSTR